MKGGLFLGVFAVFWTGMVGTFDVLLLQTLIRQSAAQRYPSVAGRVTRSEVTRHSGSKGGSTFGVRFEYLYRVGDVEHRGERYRYGDFSSSDSTWAHAAVARRPVGKETRVYYNPKDPADALLEPGVDGSEWMLLLFLTPFNAVMLGFWRYGLSSVWFWWRRPPAGGLRVRSTRWQTRVCLAEFGPLTAAVTATGAAAFAAMFVIAFGFGGFHPRLPVIGITWSVVLGVGIVAGVWRWVRIVSGHYDLVIDTQGSWIEVPGKSSPRGTRRFPLEAAKWVEVDEVLHRTSKGGTSRTYIPVIHFRSGPRDSARLSTFLSPARAEALAEWLRQRLNVQGRRASGESAAG